jgi:hypothetical protein
MKNVQCNVEFGYELKNVRSDKFSYFDSCLKENTAPEYLPKGESVNSDWGNNRHLYTESHETNTTPTVTD